jgi:acyl carrier protein
MDQAQIISIVNVVLAKRGKNPISEDLSLGLRAHGFRSLDFSEVALRVESATGNELIFDATVLRSIETFQDLFNFFVQATK